ncbi:MAG: glucose 1-dehydrogenase [Chloroflexi bacterium]|nr:glucose 1-dehydrogenase [Chloroflexota bacterium]MCL5076477.1 glucose 1-dehydrogenase [Chloroflexota bacterium]
MKLDDKVAIITGGGRGIGRGISRRFAAEGAAVLIAQRDPESAARTVHEIEEAGGKASFVPTDITKPEQVAAMVEACQQRYGRVDILVNNAGVSGVNGSILDMPLELWQHFLDVNLTGTFLCAQAVGRLMVKQQIKGRIINIGSINSFRAQKNAAHYVAAKGAIPLLTMAMAVDLSPYGILVNAIAPGTISTEKTALRLANETYRNMIAKNVPLARTGRVEEVAALAVFLASDECGYIQGATIVIDGGFLAYLRFD